MVMSWDQICSLLGAFFILLAYAMESLKPGKLSRWTFQGFNAIGSLGLLIAAVVNVQYGFIVLEGVWFLISLFALGRLALAKT